MAEPSAVFRCPRCGGLMPSRAVVEQLLPPQRWPEPDTGRVPATGRHPTAADLAGVRARIAAVAAAAAAVEDRVAATFEAAAVRRPERAESLRSTAAAATEQAARERQRAQDYAADRPGAHGDSVRIRR